MKAFGFRGEHSEINFTSESPVMLKKIDIYDMAKRSLRYLINNPDPKFGYECRFSFAPLKNPPFAPDMKIDGRLDPITEGDTEARNDVAFRFMREITGDYDTGFDIEEAVHRRIIGYLKDDGFAKDVCHTHEYSNGIKNDELYVSLWCTPMLLQAESLRIQQGCGDIALAKRIFEGLEAICTRENGRAYYPYGMQFYNEHTRSVGYGGHYPTVFNGLCEYYAATADERAWALMTELAEGFVLDLMPNNLHLGNGEIDGHNHCQLHAIRAFAQFAYLSGEVRYISWCKAVYDFYRKWSVDTGWIPEIRQDPSHCNHSETCLNGDMFELELWLALSGYDELWDQLERDLRNYFGHAQFELTPALESLWRQVHPELTEEETQASLDILRGIEGGFISAMTPNDKVFEVYPGSRHFGYVEYKGKEISFDMMGCCPPEGMRAIYYAWKFAQQVTDDRVTVYIPIDSSSDAADVASELPMRGRLTIKMKQSLPLYVRIPAWTLRSEVTVKVNGEARKVIPGGCANGYVMIEGLAPCDVVEVCYPLIDFYQTVTVSPMGHTPEVYRYHWIGNTVAEVEPQGEYLPIFE